MEDDEMLEFARTMTATMGQLVNSMNNSNQNVQEATAWIASLTLLASATLHALTKRPQNPGTYLRELLERSAVMVEESGESAHTAQAIRQVLEMADLMEESSLEESLRKLRVCH
jgi:hypothetical protein